MKINSSEDERFLNLYINHITLMPLQGIEEEVSSMMISAFTTFKCLSYNIVPPALLCCNKVSMSNSKGDDAYDSRVRKSNSINEGKSGGLSKEMDFITIIIILGAIFLLCYNIFFQLTELSQISR